MARNRSGHLLLLFLVSCSSPRQAAIDPLATVEKICMPGYTKTVRHVPLKLKKQVCEAHGIVKNCPGADYEIDHIVSLELGGTNDPSNLFPEPIAEAKEKDKVENYLHQEVCNGRLELSKAQQIIASHWKDYVKK